MKSRGQGDEAGWGGAALDEGGPPREDLSGKMTLEPRSR